MKKFRPITHKVNSIIIISLIFGLGLITTYFSYNQNTELINTTKSNLRQQGWILYQSIKNAMLPGDAPVAVSLFSDIEDIDPLNDIMLYKADGSEAFIDNSTIEFVNSNIMKDIFETYPADRKEQAAVNMDDKFIEAVDTWSTTEFQVNTESGTFFTIYKPLLNLPKCTGCHGSDHTIRGVIKISSDISTIPTRQRINLIIAGIRHQPISFLSRIWIAISFIIVISLSIFTIIYPIQLGAKKLLEN